MASGYDRSKIKSSANKMDRNGGLIESNLTTVFL